jgi:predicted permease
VTADIRYALRLLVRIPVWTAAAILSLAIGIGANTTVFALVDAVLLEPFPYQQPDRLVFIWGSRQAEVTRGLSAADLTDWRTGSRSLTAVDAFLGQQRYSLGADESDRVAGACLGDGVLPLLGVRPVLGRNFRPEETRGRGEPVVLLSHGLWRERFASDPLVVGKPLALNGRPFEVVGVLPEGFFFPDVDARLWTPAPCGLAAFDARGSVLLHAVGRLAAGTTAEAAQTELQAISSRAAAQQGGPATTPGVFPIRRILIGRYELALWTLLAGVGVVLVMGCANVVHLQLVRGLDRQTELAVRSALGGSRRQLMRQMLTESALLTLAACAVAALVAGTMLAVLRSAAITDIPRLSHAGLDLRLVAGMVLV